MNRTFPNPFVRPLLPLTALIVSASLFPLAGRLQAQPGNISAAAEAKSDAAKGALKEVDLQIDQVGELIAHAPTMEEKSAAKARLETLKQRRNELRTTYVQARYDSLKADLQSEFSKVSAWSKTRLSRRSDLVSETAPTTDAAVHPAADNTSADIAAYRAEPTEGNKADVKASLAVLDAEIDRLDQRADTLPRGNERDAAKLRVKALKERRATLTSDFRKAQFDPLKSDVKAEWNKIVH